MLRIDFLFFLFKIDDLALNFRHCLCREKKVSSVQFYDVELCSAS